MTAPMREKRRSTHWVLTLSSLVLKNLLPKLWAIELITVLYNSYTNKPSP